MERVAIFAALRWECRPVLRHLRRVRRSRGAACTFWRGDAAGREIWLVKTAVGERRAAAATEVLPDAGGFDVFLSTGCAGALSPELVPGDLTIATTVIGNAQRFDTDPAHCERARVAAERAALRATVGPILCSGRVLTRAADKRAAAVATGSVAVEMEGAGIAAVAQRAGIPFVSVRAILDTAATELPESADFMDSNTGTLKILDVARHVARHPGTFAQLLAMQRMMAAAQRSLEKFFEVWLSG